MVAYLFLAASLLPLLFGPLIADWADGSAKARLAMNGFVRVSLGGLLLFHVLPHAYDAAGATVLGAVAVGLVIPLLAHRQIQRHEGGVFSGLAVAAFLGLTVHSMLDGMALFSPAAGGHGEHAEVATLLAAAVVLHRLPMALVIWWLAVPLVGRKVAWAQLASIAAATVLGFAVAGDLLINASSPGVALFQATVAGMLLHVFAGGSYHGEAHSRGERLVSAVGVVLGILLLALSTWVHPLAGLPGSVAVLLAAVFLVALTWQGLRDVLRGGGRDGSGRAMPS